MTRLNLRTSWLVTVIVLGCLSTCIAYDALDPTGNVTIIWDVTGWAEDGYMAKVNIYNYQQFRKIDTPGWALTWNWTNGEFIWDISGAEATQQGDCSQVQFPGAKAPHCCMQYPVVMDVVPDEKNPDGPVKNCCKGGYIGALAQEPDKSLASFKMNVGNASTTIFSFYPPANFSLGIDGYTCTDPVKTNASLYNITNSRRKAQALVTYAVVCKYSSLSLQKKQLPKCCVSLSAFYNKTIIPCSGCSCACGNYSSQATLCTATGDEVPFLMSTATGDGMSLQDVEGSMECSPDGCPISIHYHIKDNYHGYWRSKLTVINRSLWTNYTDWSVVMEHPNIGNMTDSFSWKAMTLQPYGVNNTAIFWGMPDYNTVLLPAGQGGNVQSEFLFAKRDDFTLDEGWGFPRKILFNGYECVMPEEYPELPAKAALSVTAQRSSILLGAFLAAILIVLL